jgi:hypothetical protein
MDGDWINDLDLSTLTSDQFSTFFFDRPIVADDATYDLFLGEFETFAISVANPAAMVANVQAMCRNFAELAKIHSPEQLDQGLWAVFSTVRCGQYLFDFAIDSRLRIDCVESMYLPFRDVVALRPTDVKESFYWMWWDEILHDLDPMPKEYKYGYLTLTNDQSQMIETIFQTLSKILAIDHRGCQICALHGLGHLYHPSSEKLVQRYLDEHRSEFNAEDIQWIEDCRDSSVQ